jgi:AcrR family transcriptional regulator
MARPLSEQKRTAILNAAARAIAAAGLGASTSQIAKAAGVATGALFLYFPTKDDLLNQLYVVIKSEIAESMLADYPKNKAAQTRLRSIWMAYLNWGLQNEDKRKAMAQLSVSNQITEATRKASLQPLKEISKLLEECVNPETGQSVAFVSALMTSLSELTLHFMASDRKKAKQYAEMGFESLVRAIACN